MLGSVSVYAEVTDDVVRPRENAKTTPHGYNPGGFCSSGAENMMAKLQNANKAKFEQINEYKKQINDLTNYNNVLSDVTAIKDRYLDSIDKLSNGNDDLAGNIDNAKSLIKHGLILSALQGAGNNPENAEKKSVTVKDLCANGNQKGLCTITGESKPGDSTSILAKARNMLMPANDDSFDPKVTREADKLNKTLENFQRVSQSLPSTKQESLKQEVKKIVSDIPKDIAPEAILDSLDKDSPIMTRILSGETSREDLLLCLSKEKSRQSTDACKKILNNPEDRQLLIDSISSENKKLTGNMKNYTSVIKIAKDSSKNDLENYLEDYDAKKDAPVTAEEKDMLNINASKLIQSSSKLDSVNMLIKENLRLSQTNIDKLLDKSVEERTKDKMLMKETDLVGMENFFYVKTTPEKLKAMGVDLQTKEGAVRAQELQQTAIDNAKRDSDLFKNECDFSSQSTVSKDQMRVCKGLFEKLIPQVKALKTAHLDQLNDLNLKIQRLASDSDFAATENLKEYVAEKYLCSCEKNKKNVKTTYEESLTMSANSCSTQFMTLSKIEGLSDSTNVIAQALYAHEIKMPMDKQGCTFAPEELKAFTDTCNNSESVRSQYGDVCSSINNEYVAKVKVQQDVEKQNAKWEKYNDENYVEYNRKSPTGYSAVKKKSTMRVIGEGVLPILPNALPIWFGNYQMKNTINTLTDQALLQKQYLHNIDIYNSSPWMYNYNYFSYGNPFATNTSLSTTTSSTGFNFGL